MKLEKMKKDPEVQKIISEWIAQGKTDKEIDDLMVDDK